MILDRMRVLILNHKWAAVNFTRRLTLLLAVLVGMALAACSSTQPPTGTTTPENITASPTTAQVSPTPRRPTPTPTPSPTPTLPPHLQVESSALKGQVVDFWHPWQGSLAQRVEDAALAFNKENEWGLVVRVRPLYGSSALVETFESLPPAEDGPELVAVQPEVLSGWQGEGRLADLNDYLTLRERGLTVSQVSDFDPLFWDQNLDGAGRRAGIPAVRGARVLFYNQTWAEELGFNQAPSTPVEFEAQACAAAKTMIDAPVLEQRGTGGWLVSNDALTTLSWLAAFGAHPVPGKEGSAYHFDSPEAANALKYLQSLSEKGCAWRGRLQEPYDYFAGRLALFYAGSLQDLSSQARAQERANSGDRWTLIPFPSEKGTPLVYATGFSYAIVDSTPELQMGAWLFLRYLLSPRSQALLAEVWPSLPVSDAALAELSDYKANFPWFMILPLRESLLAAPQVSSWRKVQSVVEDAAWQLYNLPADQVQFILPQLDLMAEELSGR